jgi:acyl carrier protein
MTDILAGITDILINTLDLDVSPEEVTPDATLFHEGLGLDSIDVLELVVSIEERWDVRIDNRELGEEVFVSVGTLADYIAANRAKP